MLKDLKPLMNLGTSLIICPYSSGRYVFMNVLFIWICLYDCYMIVFIYTWAFWDTLQSHIYMSACVYSYELCNIYILFFTWYTELFPKNYLSTFFLVLIDPSPLYKKSSHLRVLKRSFCHKLESEVFFLVVI